MNRIYLLTESILIFALGTMFVTGCSFDMESAGHKTTESCLTVDEPDVELGLISEETDSISHTYVLRNVTGDSVFIERISKSCGCTNVYCEKSVVLPGDSVTVTAKMKSVGYTGWIVRQIDVYASGQDFPISLTFSAYIPMPIDAMKAKYYYKLYADVFVDAPAVYVGNVYKGSSGTGAIEIVNFSESEKAISFDADSEAISIGTISRLSSKRPEQIKVVYEFTESTEKWGVDTAKIGLTIEDKTVELDVIANVVPYPKPVRTKLKPKAFSASTEMIYSNAGEVKFFNIRNIGTGNLNILEVRASEHVNVERYDSLIPPSADGKLHFKLTEMMSEEESIEVLTDDPFTPILYYKIKSRY